MGNSIFAPTVSHRMSFFGLDLKLKIGSDQIIIFYNIDEIASIIRNSITRIDPRGISEEKRVSDTVYKINLKNITIREFKDGRDFIVSQRLLCLIFEDLLRAGWALKAAVNLRKDEKRCSLFFHKDLSAPVRPSDGSLLAVCLKHDDKLYLCNADAAIKRLVAKELTTHWRPGIQDFENYNDNECKIKLNGFPWRVGGFHPSLLHTRQLIMSLLHVLEENGFEFYASTHPAGEEKAVDTLYFTRNSQVVPMGETFVFGLLKENVIYLVNAPTNVVDAVRRCITSHWKSGIESEKTEATMVYIKLNGHPWTAESEDRRKARLLVVYLFESMREYGWRVNSTHDLTYFYDDMSCFVMKQCKAESVRHFALSLHGFDSVFPLNAPPEIEKLFYEDFPNEWPKKVRKETFIDETYVSLPGLFFDCVGIFSIILERLKVKGWEIITSADLAANFVYKSDERHSKDYHTLIFQETREVGSAPPIGFEGFATAF